MKKIISAAILLIIFNLGCLYLIYDSNLSLDEIDNNIKDKENQIEEVVIIPHTLKDNTIYKKLSIDEIVVSDSDTNLSVKWLYNSEDKEYYLYLPTSFDRRKLNIKFSIKKETIITAYDESGKKIGESYNEEISSIFNHDKVTLKLETNVEKISEYKINVVISDIPTLFIDVDGGNKAFKQILSSSNHSVSKTGKFSLVDTNGEITSIDMKKFKGRGNATWTRPKKPFAIKLSKNSSILGMKSSNDWLLITNYADGSLSRNSLFLYFADAIGLDYTPEYRPVDVFINNEYYGNYILTSKVESDESRVDNNDDYLLEIENHPDGNEIRLKSGNLISIKNPDLDKLSSKEKSTLKNNLRTKLNKLEEVLNDPKIKQKDLEKYIDLESFAKYYWVQELSLNFDVQRGSNYFYYKDGKIYAGPIWDMDNTLNRSYIYAPNTGYFTLDNYALSRRIRNNWFRGLFNKKYFQELADKIFIENMDLISKLPEKLDEYYKMIDTSIKMNYIRWPYKAMMVQDPKHPWRKGDKSYADAKDIFKTSLIDRINWYKNQYEIYDKFQYEIENKNGKKTTGTFSKNNKVTLSKSYAESKIVIYGIKEDGTKVKVKEESLKEGNNDIEIISNKKTTSKYKKINQSKYLISIY